uniref:glutathione transferase n=1 Tax=Panagrolaimus superbus TaxID=310955 RepID=A0A914Z0B6_9BILA
MFALQCQDALEAVHPWIVSAIRKESEEKIAEAWNNIAVPKFRDTFGKYFEAQLKKNGSGYLIGDKISWVDFIAASFCDVMVYRGNSSALDEFPLLKTFWKNIYANPKLAAAIEKEHSYSF